MADVQYDQLVVCAQCGQETPNYEDCVLCGHALQETDAPPLDLAEDDLQTMMMDAKLQEIKAKRELAYDDPWDHAPWLDELHKLAQIAPDHPKLLLTIGAALIEGGEYRPAIVSLTPALIADPSLADAYRRRADCQYILVPVLGGDTQAYYDRALADYEVALSLDPDAYTYNAHAALVGSLGEWQAAIQEYGQAIDLAPDYPETFFNRGYAHKVLGNRDQAIADLERFLSFDVHWNQEMVAQAQAHIKEMLDADL